MACDRSKGLSEEKKINKKKIYARNRYQNMPEEEKKQEGKKNQICIMTPEKLQQSLKQIV